MASSSAASGRVFVYILHFAKDVLFVSCLSDCILGDGTRILPVDEAGLRREAPGWLVRVASQRSVDTPSDDFTFRYSSGQIHRPSALINTQYSEPHTRYSILDNSLGTHKTRFRARLRAGKTER